MLIVLLKMLLRMAQAVEDKRNRCSIETQIIKLTKAGVRCSTEAMEVSIVACPLGVV
jgi:hypothetical protein